MDCEKNCPVKSSEKCLREKCEFWVTEVIEARPEQCVKKLYANDFMSQKDYMDLVRLSLMSGKVKNALNEITTELAQFGKPSVFHPIKSKRITEKQNELKRLQEHSKSINVFLASIFKRYEKVKQNLVNSMLRKGAYSLNYEIYDIETLSWEIGGVRLGEDKIIGHCLLSDSSDAIKNYLNNQKDSLGNAEEMN